MQVPSVFFWIAPSDDNVVYVCYLGAATALVQRPLPPCSLLLAHLALVDTAEAPPCALLLPSRGRGVLTFISLTQHPPQL